MLNLVVKIFSVLNSEASIRQISWAIVLATALGFIPASNLLFVLILFLICILRVNLSIAIVAFTLSSGVAYFLSPLFVATGEYLLTLESLKTFWQACYQSDVLRLMHFNQTRVLGSFVIMLVLAAPLYFFSYYLISTYRERFAAWVDKLAIVRVLKASKVYQLYQQTQLRGL